METFLTKDGFEVKTLNDPSGAPEEVKVGGYHLVVLDLMMPKMDGLQVLERIRKVDNDVAVVIFTGYPSLETAVQSMKLDAVDYLKKPFNPEEFRIVVDRVMRKKGLLRTPEENLHRVIGETIRTLRKDRNLTLKQMARRTGLSVSLLSQIERAESSASISSLYKIAVALDSRIRELFGEY
jgi:DNA-binding response OmpR family regulator